MFFNPKHILIKIIAIALCVCMAWQDVVWAAGTGSHLRGGKGYLRQRQYIEAEQARAMQPVRPSMAQANGEEKKESQEISTLKDILTRLGVVVFAIAFLAVSVWFGFRFIPELTGLSEKFIYWHQQYSWQIDMLIGTILLPITDFIGQFISTGKYDKRKGLLSLLFGPISGLGYHFLLKLIIDKMPQPEGFSLASVSAYLKGVKSWRSVAMSTVRLLISGQYTFTPSIADKEKHPWLRQFFKFWDVFLIFFAPHLFVNTWILGLPGGFQVLMIYITKTGFQSIRAIITHHEKPFLLERLYMRLVDKYVKKATEAVEAPEAVISETAPESKTAQQNEINKSTEIYTGFCRRHLATITTDVEALKRIFRTIPWNLRLEVAENVFEKLREQNSLNEDIRLYLAPIAKSIEEDRRLRLGGQNISSGQASGENLYILGSDVPVEGADNGTNSGTAGAIGKSGTEKVEQTGRKKFIKYIYRRIVRLRGIPEAKRQVLNGVLKTFLSIEAVIAVTRFVIAGTSIVAVITKVLSPFIGGAAALVAFVGLGGIGRFIYLSLAMLFSKKYRENLSIWTPIIAVLPFNAGLIAILRETGIGLVDVYHLGNISRKVCMAAQRSMADWEDGGLSEEDVRAINNYSYEIAEVILKFQKERLPYWWLRFFNIIISEYRLRIRKAWIGPKTPFYLSRGKMFLYIDSEEKINAARQMIESAGWARDDEGKIIKGRFFYFDWKHFIETLEAEKPYLSEEGFIRPLLEEDEPAEADAGAAGIGTVIVVVLLSAFVGFCLYIAALGILYTLDVIKRPIWPFRQITKSQARLFWAGETIRERYPSQPGAYSKLIEQKIKAIEFLEKYPDKENVKALLDIASEDDEVPAVQYRAHQALIKLGFPAAQDSIYCNYDNISIRQAAEQITAGLEDPEDRILAISRWVQENIVFEFVDFEAPASATLASKKGTCYHATNLQVALLRAMGFRARFIITRFRNEVFRELVPPSYYKTLGELSPHVYCEILYINDWHRFDVIQDKNLRPSFSEGHVSHEGVYPLDVESGRELKMYDSLDKFIARGSRRVMQQKVPYLEEINSHIRNKFGELSIYDLFQQVIKEIGQRTFTAGQDENDTHQASAGGMASEGNKGGIFATPANPLMGKAFPLQQNTAVAETKATGIDGKEYEEAFVDPAGREKSDERLGLVDGQIKERVAERNGQPVNAGDAVREAEWFLALLTEKGEDEEYRYLICSDKLFKENIPPHMLGMPSIIRDTVRILYSENAEPSAELLIAAMFHDSDRFFDGYYMRGEDEIAKGEIDYEHPRYKNYIKPIQHPRLAAEFVMPRLTALGIYERTRQKVDILIRNHETGIDPRRVQKPQGFSDEEWEQLIEDSRILKSADALSYFQPEIFVNAYKAQARLGTPEQFDMEVKERYARLLETSELRAYIDEKMAENFRKGVFAADYLDKTNPDPDRPYVYEVFLRVQAKAAASASGGNTATVGEQNTSLWYVPDKKREDLLVKYSVYTPDELADLAGLYRLYLWNGELSPHQKVLVWTYMILMRLDERPEFQPLKEFIGNKDEIDGLYIGYEWSAAMSLRKRLRIARRAIRKAKFVIEVGCTDGDVLIKLTAERPGTNFLGLDASPYNIRSAVERLAKKRKPPKNLKFKVRDCRPAVEGMSNRGIPPLNEKGWNGKTGAVLLIEGVMDSEGYPQQWKKELAQEALRVLRPGGRIGFIGIYGQEEILKEAARRGFSIEPDKISKRDYHRLLRGIGGDYETGKLGKVGGFVWRVQRPLHAVEEKPQAAGAANGTTATAGEARAAGGPTDGLAAEDLASIAAKDLASIAEQAIKGNLGYQEGIRPKDRNGRPGGLLKLTGIEQVAHISDLHSRYQNLLDILNDSDNLKALETGALHLVITGDIISKRGKSRNPETCRDIMQTLSLVMKLRAKFPENVHILMGSHEMGLIFGRRPKTVDGKPVIERSAFAEKFRLYIEEEFDQQAYEKIRQFLETLPVAAIVQIGAKKVFFTHAGILEGLDEDALVNILTGIQRQRLYEMLNWPESDIGKISATLGRLGVDIMVTGHFHRTSMYRAQHSPYKETEEDGFLTVVTLPEGRFYFLATQETKEGPVGYIHLTATNVNSLEGIFRHVSAAGGTGTATAGEAVTRVRDAAIARAVGRAERRQVAMLLALATAFISLCEEAKRRVARQKTVLIIDSNKPHAEQIEQRIRMDGQREFREIVILINPSQKEVDELLMQKDVDLVIDYRYNIGINSYPGLRLFLIQPDISTDLNTIGEQVEDWLVEQCV